MAKVLLVDDDPENLWALQMALESDGHCVSVAGGADRAMDILRREHIQLLVTDYEMPGIDGAQLSVWARAQPAHAELPIVLLSAGPEPAGGICCWTRFLRKPTDLADLSLAIDAYVAARLTATPRGHGIATAHTALERQYPSSARWPAVDPRCWP